MKTENMKIGISLLCSLFLLFLFQEHGDAAQKLRLLVWEGYAPPAQVQYFEQYIEKKYNQKVTLEVTYIIDPNEFFNQVRGKKVDIISPTHNLVKDNRYNFIKKRLILPIDLNNIPNYKDVIPSLQKADYITENGKVYGTPLVQGPYGLAYNAKRIEEPDSWEIFWDPLFRNKYTIAEDYYEVNIYITALALGYKGSDLHEYAALNNPEFRGKLSTLVKNAKSFWKGVDKADDLQGMTLAAVWGFSFPELKKRGEDWRLANPKEGTMSWIDNYLIGYSLKNKPFLKRVAEEWLNFTLSPKFQVETVVRELGSSPVNLAIRDQLTPEEVERTHIDDPDYFQDFRIPWPTIKTQRDRNGMMKLWQRAMKQRK